MAATKRRPDLVSYWPSVESDGFPVAGPITAPIEQIYVRWQDLMETFIDLEGREQVSRAVIYSDPGLNRGGYLMRSLSIGPQYVETYPPVVPHTLEGYLEYWKFNNNLNGVKGNDFVLSGGNAFYDAGVLDECITTGGDSGYSLDTMSDLSIDDFDEFSISGWFSSTTPGYGSSSIVLSITNNLRLTIEVGQVNRIIWGDDALVDITISNQDVGFLSEFTHIAVNWKRDKIQDIYINGFKADAGTTDIYDSLLTENSLNVTTDVNEGSILLDELRVYGEVLTLKDIQYLAAVHPQQYTKDAFEIRQTYETHNLKGSKVIYKSWLKSRD